MAQSISDEELQLKKRARRRLVGAVALVLLAVIFLPMVLDKEPKPVGQDIAIRIPSQEGTPFQPQTAAVPKPVQAAPVAPAENKPIAPDSTQQPSKAAAGAESKPVSAPADKLVAGHADVKSAEAAHAESQQKSVAPVTENSKSGKSEAAEKAAKNAATARHDASAKSQGYVIQLGAFANMDNAKQRQAKLNALGVRFYTEKIKSPVGDKLRVRAGPYATREEAEKVQGRLKSQGITDGVVAEKNS